MAGMGHLQEELAPERVAELLRDDQVQLVDVREPYEHDAGHIAGAAHVPLDRLSQEGGALERERPLVFYCRVGSRSAMATQAFRAAGFDAYNMAGGIAAWAERGLPIAPDGGRVAEH